MERKEWTYKARAARTMLPGYDALHIQAAREDLPPDYEPYSLCEVKDFGLSFIIGKPKGWRDRKYTLPPLPERETFFNIVKKAYMPVTVREVEVGNRRTVEVKPL